VATSNVEHYLEAIYVLSVETQNPFSARIAEYLGVSAPSVTQAMRRLKRDGLVEDDGRKALRLTPKGLVEAEQVVRRHRLAERWAHDVLGLDWAECHQEAHHLEHALTPLLEERLWQSLGRPTTCPHGNPIPGLSQSESSPLRTLAETPAGLQVVVDRVFEQVEGLGEFLQELQQQGLVPGAELKILKNTPDGLTCEMGEKSFTVSLETARRLAVRSTG
jgi:DtxR family Mn-dependent transcriptional regulator